MGILVNKCIMLKYKYITLLVLQVFKHKITPKVELWGYFIPHLY